MRRFWLSRVLVGVCAVLAAAAAGLAPHHVAVAGSPRLVTQNVHFRRDSIGGLWAFGEVVNRGTAPAASIAVEVGVYNNQGQRLARGVTLAAAVNVLQPGQKTVWQTDMTDNPKSWNRVKVQAVRTVTVTDLLQRNYTQIRITHWTLSVANPGYSQKLSGQVQNTGRATAHIDEITAAFYNAKGQLRFVADQGLLYPWSDKQNLGAGKTAPFTVEVLTPKKFARVVLYVRAERP